MEASRHSTPTPNAVSFPAPAITAAGTQPVLSSTPITVHLFGRPQVEQGGSVFVLPPERRGLLLAVLALRGDWVARAELAALLWPALVRERALANLRKSLHLAREWPFAAGLETSTEAVRWCVATDVQHSLRAEREGRLAEAIASRRGPLLDGFDAADPGRTEWLHAERAQHERDWQRLTRARLAELDPEPAEAAVFAQRLLRANPLDEDAVVALLAAQRALQRFDEQRQTLRAYTLLLDEELGVEPSARVRAQMRAAPVRAGAQQQRDAEGLIGRADEAQQLLALLSERRVRIVTVTGAGGVGKSSLLKSALRGWRGPLLWLALDDLADLSQAQARLALALGVTTPPGPQSADPLGTVCVRLAGQPHLIALDNCEHLEGIARLAARLLTAHPDVQIVATSRKRLALAGEHLLPLDGLALPAENAATDAVMASDAWRLFAAAAVQARPGFDVAAEPSTIARIVRHLGGLPLAILLAAYWVRHLSLEQIESDLRGSLDLLESDEEGDERPEHRSVRATFERSWRSLATREQRCLAALAVFPGDGSRAAAQEVGAASMPLLALLADNSLLRFGADGRISMHPLLRRFAAVKLCGAAHDEALRRHAMFHLQWMSQRAAAADRGEAPALREVGTELENCRLAWRWALAHGAQDAIADCGMVLKQYHAVCGSPADGLALLLEASACIDDAPALAGASLSVALSQLQARLGRLDEAQANARRAITLARACGRRDLVGRALMALASTQFQRGAAPQAARSFHQAERHARASHDTVGVLLALSNAALAECYVGQHERAALAMEGVIRTYRSLGQSARVAANLTNLSNVRLIQQQWSAARQVALEAIALCEREQIAQPVPALLLNLAVAATGLEELAPADELCRKAMRLAHAQANGEIEAAAAAQRVRISIAQGDTQAATVRLREALPLARGAAHRQAQLDLVLSHLRLASLHGRPDAGWLRWYLAQEDLEPADRASAKASLQALSTRARRVPMPVASADEMLASIERLLHLPSSVS